MVESFPNRQKTLWEKDKLLVTSNLSFSHSVFKRPAQQTCLNQGLFGKGLNLYQRQNFGLVQIESICRPQIKCDSKTEICFGKGRKHCGKKRKCWLPAFSPFPIMFSEGFLRVVKSWDCVVKPSQV